MSLTDARVIASLKTAFCQGEENYAEGLISEEPLGISATYFADAGKLKRFQNQLNKC